MATPITPNTDVFLLKCPLEMDNQHQMNFATRQAQINYFASLPKIEMEKFSYQRADGVIRVENHIDDIIGYNYVMYRNNNYTNRWFFAFITGMEYVNDHCTYVSIKTDVFQTWQFDLSWKRCFVEREHVNNDTFGLHTLEENIASGEIINNATQQIEITNPKECFVVVLLTKLKGGLASHYGNNKRIYNGIPQGCFVVMVDISDSASSYANLNNLIRYYDSVGASDAITAMYLVPKSLMGKQGDDYAEMSIELGGGYGFDGFVPKASTGVKLVSTNTVSRNTTLNGYSPKNNKCFTRQFNYLMITNNAGESAMFNWEDFSGTPTFKLLATFAQTCPTKLVPTNYKNNDEPSGNIYALTGCPFPLVSWDSDYYLNWQAKQGWSGWYQRGGETWGKMENDVYNNSGQNDILGVASSFASTATQGLSAIFNTINGSMAQAERVPNQIQGNAMNNEFTFSINKCKFTLYKMSMRAEVAKVVDDYFSAYGYKVSTWKTPNLTGRRNWNFVKLNQANITGNIPQTDMDEIKGMFLKGITIWHNPSTFLDYSQNNSIV